KGKGIGLALLSFSLQDCKRRGYENQITWVRAENLKMLNASVQMLGYEKIGEIHTKKIFLKPFSKWMLNESFESNKIMFE
ncbi:MAG: hypothetical protein R3255_11015, partial [Candidatus Lokiarchaeia archaeon]|nr:hypothetical protein [Candidatus Lokiarchaeia archaeon]